MERTANSWVCLLYTSTLDNGLWWKKEKTIHTHETAGVVPDWLRVAPQALLLLSGQLL